MEQPKQTKKKSKKKEKEYVEDFEEHDNNFCPAINFSSDITTNLNGLEQSVTNSYQISEMALSNSLKPLEIKKPVNTDFEWDKEMFEFRSELENIKKSETSKLLVNTSALKQTQDLMEPNILFIKDVAYTLKERRGIHRDTPVWKGMLVQPNDKKAEEVCLKLLNCQNRRKYESYESNLYYQPSHHSEKDDYFEYKKSPKSTNLSEKAMHEISVIREVMLLHRLSKFNKSILPVKALCRAHVTSLKSATSSRPGIFMAIPLVDYDMDFYIAQYLQDWSPRLIKWLFFQLVRVVTYLHSAHIVHRDIEPSSVMISKTNSAEIWLVSCSLARNVVSKQELDPLPKSLIETYFGYRAPEVIISPDNVQKRFTGDMWKAADMWSVGTVFGWMLRSGKVMFGEKLGPESTIEKMMEIKEIRESCGDVKDKFRDWIKNDKNSMLELKDLVGDFVDEKGLHLLKRLLCVDMKKRITAMDALAHPYFEEFRDLLKEKPGNWCFPSSCSNLLADSNVHQFVKVACPGIFKKR